MLTTGASSSQVGALSGLAEGSHRKWPSPSGCGPGSDGLGRRLGVLGHPAGPSVTVDQAGR